MDNILLLIIPHILNKFLTTIYPLRTFNNKRRQAATDSFMFDCPEISFSVHLKKNQQNKRDHQILYQM